MSTFNDPRFHEDALLDLARDPRLIPMLLSLAETLTKNISGRGRDATNMMAALQTCRDTLDAGRRYVDPLSEGELEFDRKAILEGVNAAESALLAAVAGQEG